MEYNKNIELTSIELLDWTHKIFLGILNAVLEKLVCYLQSNNELIQIKILMKNAIVTTPNAIDTAPFRQ